MRDIDKKLLNNFRRLQMVLTIVIFSFVTVLCWNTTGLDITSIQISFWGVDNSLSWLWNGCVIVISIAICYNVLYWIYTHPRMIHKNIFMFLFIVSTVSLFLVGVFPTVKYTLIHNITAYIYFFLYPLTIFVMSFINRKTMIYNEWLKHVIICVLMIVLPLSIITKFPGLAISEILHTVMVVIWNLNILRDFK